jgi:hypothetical protein
MGEGRVSINGKPLGPMQRPGVSGSISPAPRRVDGSASPNHPLLLSAASAVLQLQPAGCARA